MLELFPEGFEEVDVDGGVELAAYTNAAGEERLWHAFGGIRTTDVAPDWADRWREFHQPRRVGPLWVGPPWLDPPGDAVAVSVDPGRAFGTGAHATTRLALELLLDVPRGSVLDVGCGSGVLAIAASKLGFEPVFALDVDPAAVEATERNAAANGVLLEARLDDAVAADLPPADVAVANISLEAVLAIGERLESRRLVTSGYLGSDLPELRGYDHVERRTDEGWAADFYVRRTQ